jgi:hypothetical protein
MNNAKLAATWIAVAVVMWLVITDPRAANHVMHNIGAFLSTSIHGISAFLAKI